MYKEREWRWILFTGICSLVLHLTYFNVGIKNLLDLGVVAVDSERILAGQLFGHDFIAPYGPGRYYLIAAVFYLFGPSMTALLGVFCVLRICVDLGTYLLARRLVSPFSAACAALCVAMAHGPTHKGFLTTGTLLVTLAAAFFINKPSKSRAFLMGGAAGLAGTFRYDLGILGLIIGAAALFSFWKKGWIAFFSGLLLFSLPCAAVLLSTDISRIFNFELLRADLLKDAQSTAPGIFSSIGSWTLPATSLLSLALICAPCLLLLTVAFTKDRCGKKLKIIIALSGILLFSQYMIEPKINRLLQVGPLLFISAFIMLHMASSRIPSKIGKLLCPAMLALLTLWFVISESGDGSIDSPAVLKNEQVKILSDKAGFSTVSNTAENLTHPLTWIKKCAADEQVFLSPFIPLVYFLADKTNPCPVTDFTYILRNREMQKQILSSLENEKIHFYIEKLLIVQGFNSLNEAPLFHAELKMLFPRLIARLPGGYTVYSK